MTTKKMQRVTSCNIEMRAGKLNQLILLIASRKISAIELQETNYQNKLKSWFQRLRHLVEIISSLVLKVDNIWQPSKIQM